MAHKIGYLDELGHPRISVRVWGVTEQFARNFEVMIDTGFTGFVMIPFAEALPLALTLWGTTNFTLADGREAPHLQALGTVSVGDEQQFGLVTLGSSHLVGMEFLKAFKKALMIGTFGVHLADDAPESESPPEKAEGASA